MNIGVFLAKMGKIAKKWLRTSVFGCLDPIVTRELTEGKRYFSVTITENRWLLVREYRAMGPIERRGDGLMTDPKDKLMCELPGMEFLDLKTGERQFHLLASLGVGAKENLARMFHSTIATRLRLHSLARKLDVQGYMGVIRKNMSPNERDICNDLWGNENCGIRPISQQDLIYKKPYIAVIVAETGYLGMDEFVLQEIRYTPGVRIPEMLVVRTSALRQNVWDPERRSMRDAGLLPSCRHNLHRVFHALPAERAILEEIVRTADIDRYLTIIHRTLMPVEREKMAGLGLLPRREWAQALNDEPPERG